MLLSWTVKNVRVPGANSKRFYKIEKYYHRYHHHRVTIIDTTPFVVFIFIYIAKVRPSVKLMKAGHVILIIFTFPLVIMPRCLQVAKSTKEFLKELHFFVEGKINYLNIITRILSKTYGVHF